MRKKIMRIAISAALACSMLVVPAYAESAVVTGNEVNLRSGPGTNYRVIDCLEYGTELTVNDRSNGTWYAVEVNGTSGFISSAYLDIREEKPRELKVTLEPADKGNDSSTGSSEGYVNAMYVRFRSGPGSEYSILGEYNKGKSVTIYGTAGTWTACVIDGRSGFIHSDYISAGSYSAPAASTQSVPEYDIYLGGGKQDPYAGLATLTQQEAPKPSEQPMPPVSTVVPQVTASPEPVSTPVPTAVPVATMKPAPTPVPASSAAPSASASPAVISASVKTEGYINANYVCFRTGPSTSYYIIDQYSKGKMLEIEGTVGDWTACTIDGEQGYVFSQYVSRKTSSLVLNPVMDQPMENENVQPAATLAPAAVQTPAVTQTPAPVATMAPAAAEKKSAYISGNNVRLREGPSMSSGILDELFYGNDVTVTGTSGDWTAVEYNGVSGFVYSQYVKEGSLSELISASTGTSAENQNSTPAGTESGSVSGRQIVDYALQFVGYNYTWGGKSPSTGFDCSGLVYYVYGQFGYSLNRVAEDQARNGKAVEGELQPGDILCFYSGGSYIGHVGIYIGNGMFVHAQNSATGVVITELEGSYSNRGYVARRIV